MACTARGAGRARGVRQNNVKDRRITSRNENGGGERDVGGYLRGETGGNNEGLLMMHAALEVQMQKSKGMLSKAKAKQEAKQRQYKSNTKQREREAARRWGKGGERERGKTKGGGEKMKLTKK